MCGVFGLVWRDGCVPGGIEAARSASRAMRDCLIHRGPDGAGVFERGNVLLGHLRLAIIDLEGGRQPMLSGDEKVALSYNGECYNFHELMSEFTSRGWHFASSSDTETVLAAYCLDGPQFDDKLNGMYAYALLDRRSGPGSIHLSSDPVGIKPLFLYERDGLVLFASELRAIIAGLKRLGQPIEMDQRAVAAYLRLGWVPAPLSLIKGARKLLPGERWTIRLDDCVPRLRSIRLIPVQEAPASEAELGVRLAETLERAIARQTIADVPLGFFLSGGIDSSLILAVARAQGHTAHSFTIRFVGEGHGVLAANEADIAQAVAERLGSPFHCIDVDADSMRRNLDDALLSMDQPIADPACLPLLLLSRFARESVKVCLSGDGGDELFAGYPRHGLVALRGIWRRLPQSIQDAARVVAAKLPAAPSSGAAEGLRKLGVGHTLIDAREYVSGPFAGALEPDFELEPWNYNVNTSSVMSADLAGQLAGQMLPKTDNMSMAASLECRVPLLDLELVSLAASTPWSWKRSRWAGKLPLRRQLSRYLSPEVTERPKHGFRVPLTSWFRGAMADELRDRLLSPSNEIEEFLGPQAIAEMVDAHLSGRAEHSIRLWTLLAFTRWKESIETLGQT